MADEAEVKTEEKPSYPPKITVIGKRVFSLVPLADAMPRDVEFTFAHVERFKTSGTDAGQSKGLKGEFFASTAITFEGKETTVDSGAGSLTSKKALERLFAAIPGDASEEQYQALDFANDEFLNQKYTPPAKPDFNFNDEVEFEGSLVSLSNLRAEYQERAEEASDNQRATQESAFKAASVLKVVHNHFYDRAIKGARKEPATWAKDKLEAWAVGPAGANQLSMLVKLGKGTNSVMEAMRLAELSEVERMLINSETTSGKGVDRFKNAAVKWMVLGKPEDATNPTFKVLSGKALDALPNEVKGERYMSPASTLDLLYHIARDRYGIVNAADLSDEDLFGKIDDAASDAATKFNGEHGKHYSSYDDEVYAAAISTFGMVHLAFGGPQDADEEKSEVSTSGLFRKTLEMVRRWEEAPSETEATAFILSSANKRKWLLTGYATEALRAKIADDAKNEKNKVRRAELLEKLDNVEEDGKDGIVGKQGGIKFAALDMNAAVARIYSLLQHRKGEGKPNDVQQILIALAALDAADTDRRKAQGVVKKVAAE